MIEHRPFALEAQMQLGFHNGERIFHSSRRLPDYLSQYVDDHEYVHGRIFSSFPDGVIHAIHLRLSAMFRAGGAVSEALNLAENVLADDMVRPHEEAATYIGLYEAVNEIDRRKIIASLDAEYKSYLQFYSNLIDPLTASSICRCAIARAVNRWIFSSIRLEILEVSDLFSPELISQIPGPRARSTLIQEVFSNGGLGQKILVTIQKFAEKFPGLVVIEDQSWIDNFSAPSWGWMRSDLSDEIFCMIRQSIDEPTFDGDIADANIVKALKDEIGLAHVKGDELVSTIRSTASLNDMPLEALRSFSEIGDSNRIFFNIISPLNLSDENEAIYLLFQAGKVYIDCRIYCQICALSETVSYLYLWFETEHGVETPKVFPFEMPLSFIPRCLEAISSLIEIGSRFAPVVVAFHPRMASRLDEICDLLHVPDDWAIFRKLEDTVGVFGKKSIYPLKWNGPSFTQSIADESGSIGVRRASFRNDGAISDQFHFSLFEPDDESLPSMFDAFSGVTWGHRQMFVERLQGVNHLRGVEMPSESAMLRHIIFSLPAAFCQKLSGQS